MVPHDEMRHDDRLQDALCMVQHREEEERGHTRPIGATLLL